MHTLPLVDGYTTQLAPGLYHMCHGPVTDPNCASADVLLSAVVHTMGAHGTVVVRVSAYQDDGQLYGHVDWPLGPNETLMDPYRCIADHHMWDTDLNKHLTDLGKEAYS